jgi:hypothetical protein
VAIKRSHMRTRYRYCPHRADHSGGKGDSSNIYIVALLRTITLTPPSMAVQMVRAVEMVRAGKVIRVRWSLVRAVTIVRAEQMVRVEVQVNMFVEFRNSTAVESCTWQ